MALLIFGVPSGKGAAEMRRWYKTFEIMNDKEI